MTILCRNVTLVNTNLIAGWQRQYILQPGTWQGNLIRTWNVTCFEIDNQLYPMYRCLNHGGRICNARGELLKHRT